MHKQDFYAVRCRTSRAIILLLGFLAEIKCSVSFGLCVFQSSLATDSEVVKTCSCVAFYFVLLNDFIRKYSYLSNDRSLSFIC